jgi:hypothetical protein
MGMVQNYGDKLKRQSMMVGNGIVFTDKDGNVINDTKDPNTETDESEPFNKDIEITGVDDFMTTNMNRTTQKQLPQNEQGITQKLKLAMQTKSQEWQTVAQHMTTTQKTLNIGRLNWQRNMRTLMTMCAKRKNHPKKHM